MTKMEKVKALKTVLDREVAEGRGLPMSVLRDIFTDWTKGVATDHEFVASLLPMTGQPPLVRLQILAQSLNLAQLLQSESEKMLIKEEEATMRHLEALEAMSWDEPGPAAVDATMTAFHLHLQALQTLAEANQEADAAGYLRCLELGEEAETRLAEARSLVNPT